MPTSPRPAAALALPATALALALACALPDTARARAADDAPDYNRDVLPILSENCFHCHGPDAANRKSGLRLDTFEGVTGRDGGPVAVVPGEPDESELLARVLSDDPDEVMPPPSSNRRLDAAQKDVLRRWIAAGAPHAKHWAFQTPVRPPVPVLDSGSESGPSPANPVDAFIAARLAREGLAPNPPADPARLLRRVSLDLNGLPPSPEELEAFLADPSPEAYAAAVDRLLASPRFGERMVWEWLDAARYADTNGYQGDPERPMWRWRDWVVRALNDDMPFDQFTIEQIAGDLLPEPAVDQLVATGFHRNHMINGEGGRIAEESRVEYVMDRVETTGAVWLGLTLNCARCHDHKYDPVSQVEYYRLAAYFNSIDESGANDAGGLAHPVLKLPDPEREKALAEARDAERAAVAARDEAAKRAEAALPRPPDDANVDARIALARDWLAALEEWKRAEDALKAARDAVAAADRAIPRTMIMRDRAQPRETRVLERGAYDRPVGDPLAHGVPAVLTPLPDDAPPNRLALARWLVASDQPLTPRVVVNRLWQSLFGVGIVKTAEDFGLQGERPVHPELLDWLAREFVDSGWRVKPLVRLLVTSDAYKRSSRATPELLERDPENRLLARGPRHRLPSWMIRDQALFVSGLLVERLGGPPVKGYQPDGVWEEATFGFIKYRRDSGDALYRRSLYQFWRRIVGPTMFFDVANRQTCVVRVQPTNTPLHALVLMNDVGLVEAARALASRTLLEIPGDRSDDPRRLERMFLRCVARTPAPDEAEILLARLDALRARFAERPDDARALLAVGESPVPEALAHRPAELAAWLGVASVLLNLDETLSKE